MTGDGMIDFGDYPRTWKEIAFSGLFYSVMMLFIYIVHQIYA